MSETLNLEYKSIIMLEHQEDVFQYLEVKKTIPGSHIIIATIPDVCWELEKRNIAYIGIEKYYNSDIIYTLGIKNYETVEAICSKIDSALQKMVPELKKYSFKPAFDNFYYLKILYDNLTLRITILQSIIECEKPDEIIAFSTERRPAGFQSLPFAINESIYSILLSIKNWNAQIKILPKKQKKQNELINIQDLAIEPCLRINTPFRFIYSSLIKVKNFLSNSDFNLLEFLYSKIIEAIFNKKTLFLFRADPSWSAMIDLLCLHGYQLVNLSESTESSQSESRFDIIINKQIFETIKEFCIHCNIDFSQIFEDRCFQALEEYLHLAGKIIQNVEWNINKYKPLAFLSSEKATYIEHMYAHIAQSRNIPVIAWQHGDGPFYPPMQIFVEIRDTDIHMSYGPGHQEMLNVAPHNHFSTRIESVGSLILENIYLKKSENTGKNRILYVTTQFYYNNYYINNYPVPDNSLWNYQKAILNLLGTSQIPTIFKLMPQKYETPLFSEYIKENEFNNISVVHFEKSFVDLLKDADIVICDYPSTPVIEAIAAKKTIFVLLSSPHLRQESLDLLKKRVFWCENVEDFVTMISNYLNGTSLDQNPSIENYEYFELFGVDKLDGNVSKRALEILEHKIKNLS